MMEEEVKKIVMARLSVLPGNKKISVGSAGEFTRDELIEHVEKGDELGKKFVEIEMEFLRAMKQGLIS
ncbi:MAG: hypothetical protein ACE5FT_04550 [Candidatus Nanoarchaeia archaeon]